MNTRKLVSGNLKRHLKEQKISYANLARELDVSRQAVVNWTNGYNMPSVETLEKIASLLGIPYAKLLDEESLQQERRKVLKTK